MCSDIFLNELYLVVHGRAGGLATADETGHLQVLGMIGIGAQIVPCIERTLQADIKVGIGCVRNIDTYLLRAEAGYLIQQTQQTGLDGPGVLQLSMTFGLIQEAEKYNMLNHD
jgi:hypothetical protein